jgi:cytochrome c peroxidase
MRAAWIAAAFLVLACNTPTQKSERAASTSSPERLSREPLEALPDAPILDPKLVALGRKLFDEKRLSADDTLACSSCHDLAHAGVDRIGKLARDDNIRLARGHRISVIRYGGAAAKAPSAIAGAPCG